MGQLAARAAVGAVNGLTARWAGTVARDRNTAFAAPGVWPLLAFLADGADGHARVELADALGVPADQAASAARQVLATLDGVPGVDSALGLWTRRTVEPHAAWLAGLPARAHGVLTGDEAADQRALDAWAAERTGGLVDRLPVALTDDTELVLASALAVRTGWLRPFRDRPFIPETGPWRDRVLPGLLRVSSVLDRIGVADTPDGRVTELKVLGNTPVDVHLLLGEELMTPGQVLGAGLGLLTRAYPLVPGGQLPYGEAGPGVRVVRELDTRPAPPTLDVTTVAFDLTAHHDLLAAHRLFGLTTAQDTGRAHFSGVSDFPLAVGSAAQSATASFGERGFEAAAVTAVAAVAGAAAPAPRYRTTTVEACFDRPFGFLAVHRRTRLALVAGWVGDPGTHPEGEETHDPFGV
ncbi:serpin family protein [Streptomyces sp. NPDC006997]|uniref:serpin family protein n=1 Tax=Streptomyces sp. NPDC006997 TaxID=3155356 RepID=UPI0033D5DADD